MLIAVLATGSRGDVQPYIALGKGLAEAGHDVRLVAPETFEALATGHGLSFWPLGGDVTAVAQSEEMRARLEKGNFLGILRQMAKAAKKGAVQMSKGGLAAGQGVDAVLAGIGGEFIAVALAEKFNYPVIRAYYAPYTPTRAFPSVLLPGPSAGFGSTFNRLSHHAFRQVMWQSFRSADNVARKQVLQLPPAPFFGPYNSKFTGSTPILYGFSPAVVPPPSDWGPEVHVTGYWFLDSQEAWTPPADLLAFLEAGPPPVYIGFGSMANRDPEATANLILQALARAEQRAVLLSGWQGLQKAEIPETVFMLDSAPHNWLFPRMAAVVHHGGAGTTAAGLRAGVPSIVVPFFGDQPFWGRRVAALGVGPAPISRRRLTADRLAGVIRETVSDTTMRRQAAAFGKIIQAEDGIGRAVDTIDRFAA